MDPDKDIRMTVWFLSSELYRLEGLQHFAATVEECDPVDIKRTAQILAKAQLELRKLVNSRSGYPTSKRSAVKTKI